MPQELRNARDIFLAALEQSEPAERVAFLDRACGDNATLRHRVNSLLTAHDAPESLLDQPAAGPRTEEYRPISEGPGTVIGPYKLLQQIGEGGFGVVFMAEQTAPVRRTVALKIIKPGMDSAQVIARFESERQALSLMDHPNIAKVLDVRATESGRPYFVMELVKGVPITEFCDKNHMPAEGRLKLFIDVCHAIQHAHHKGVIHRDIKPSNVMVTLHDGVPVVKVIDFGVAKATVQKLTEKTLFTAYGQMIGTPAYMSPEQAEMSGLDIDTRSDVYSLGVLLYELLTGTTPLESKRLREAGYAEMQRMIREELAPRPSTRLSSLGDSATVLAGNRGLEVRRLVQLLSGDLDWVVMKALDKDRNRRYGTPGNFAEDIERYLRRDAILARPPSAAYKLKKFSQRNRAAVLTTTAIAAALLAGTAVAVWQAVRATRAELMATGELDRAVQAEADAKTQRDKAIAAEKQAVAEKQRAEEAMNQSRLALGAFGTLIDEVQKQIGDNPGTQDLKLKLLETSLDGLNKVAKSDEDSRLLGQSTAAAYMRMGQLYLQMGQSEKAFAQYVKCHEIIQALTVKDPNSDVAMANLAATYTLLGEMSLELRREMQGSLDYYQKALAIRRQLNGRQLSEKLNPVQVKSAFAESCTRVGVTYLRLGEPKKAREFFNEALQLRQELATATKDPMMQIDVARSFNALAEVDFRMRNWPVAKEQFRKALERSEQVQGADPKNPRFQLELALTLGNVGVFDMRTGDLTAAEQHLSTSLKLMEALANADPRHLLYQRYLGLAHYRYATLARKRNDTTAAERSNLACLEIRSKLATDDPKNERRQMELMLVLPRCGQHARAAELAAKVQAGKLVDRDVIFEVAQCLAQCAAVVDQKDLHERYMQRAVEALRQAVTLGFKDAVVLETEPDLDAVRDDARFRALLTGAAGPKPGG